MSILRRAIIAAGGSADPIPAPFDILSLFSAGQNGAVYDPSEGHMYQDRAGEIPVVAGDPVGLILDGRFGYIRNPEMVVNGDFSSSANWTYSGITITGGQLVKDSAVAGILDQSMGFTTGNFYEVTYDVVSVTVAGTLKVTFESGSAASGINRTITSPGTYKEFIIAGTGNGFLRLSLASNLQCVIDNVSVKEVPGRHAYSAGDGNRPIYQTADGLHWLLADGVDDYLVTTSGTPIMQGGGYMSCAVSSSVAQGTGVFFENESGTGTTKRVGLYFNTGVAKNLLNYAPDGVGRGIPYPSTVLLNTPYCFSGASDGALITGRSNAISGGTADSTAVFTQTSGVTVLEILRQRSGPLYFSGKWYAGVIVDDILDSETISQADAWVAAKAGLTL